MSVRLSREAFRDGYSSFPQRLADALPDVRLNSTVLEHNKAPGRAPVGDGLVSLFMMNQWAVEHMDATYEQILADVLPDAEKALPGLGEAIEFLRVNRWYPVLVYSHPGLYKELGHFHATRDRASRIHLAGPYNSSGNVNTAPTPTNA